MRDKMLDSIRWCVHRRLIAIVEIQIIGESGGNPIPGKIDPIRLDAVDVQIQSMQCETRQNDNTEKKNSLYHHLLGYLFSFRRDRGATDVFCS
jgi:hypothetical protein